MNSEDHETVSYSTGANHARVRDHNERTILTIVKDRGPVSSVEIARLASISAPTASIITRGLQQDGLLMRGEPVRGKVGKPLVPLSLDPDGAYAFGLRMGRRGSELILMDLAGQVRNQKRIRYPFPTPRRVEDFVAASISELTRDLPQSESSRVAGIGIGAPFELWAWLDGLNAPAVEADVWRTYSFEQGFAAFTDLEVFVANDASMACAGELVFGTSSLPPDFVYFFIGSFVGGGVVLDGQVFLGRHGRGGALGSMPVRDVAQPGHQLNTNASMYLLQKQLEKRLQRDVALSDDPEPWEAAPDLVDAWITSSSQAIASAAIGACAVLDIGDVVLDGGFPEPIRDQFIQSLKDALSKIDSPGLRVPNVISGTLGWRAGALGAAYQPILAAHFLQGSKFV